MSSSEGAEVAGIGCVAAVAARSRSRRSSLAGASAKPRGATTRTGLMQRRHAGRRHGPPVQAADVPAERASRRATTSCSLNALAKQLRRQAEDREPRLQRPDPGPPVEEVRHGLGGPLADAGAQEGDRLQPARTCRTRRSWRRRRATRPGDGRGVERLEQDDHLAAGLDRGAARAEDCSRRRSRLVPGPERGVPAGRDRPRRRHRGRELPARAVQQVERRTSSSEVAFTRPLQVQYGA